MLYDSSDPHATPKAVEAAAFRRYVNSYAVRDQREVVAALASGLKTIDQQGPLSNDPRAMAAPLPQPCRTLPTRKVAETLRRYPDAWAMNVMQKVIHGKMALNGEATDREDE
ncbi:MAG: hypothetical protein KF705_02505 [Phycisphaeraceae bacterium]|nr:hypothetical protein [Phycisphaeraceae bacterium]